MDVRQMSIIDEESDLEHVVSWDYALTHEIATAYILRHNSGVHGAQSTSL